QWRLSGFRLGARRSHRLCRSERSRGLASGRRPRNGGRGQPDAVRADRDIVRRRRRDELQPARSAGQHGGGDMSVKVRHLRMGLFASAVVLSIAGAAIAQQPNWDAIQVTAQPIKPGVAVLFGNGGNIGVSYGEDGTLIVDDQFLPLTAKIQAAIAGLGGTPAKYLVNTHWHFDHAGGNENFGNAGTIIFAQDRVRTRLQAGGTVAGNT